MNLQARGASRKKTRTHVYKHTRAEKEAHKTHHAFLWSLFDPFTLTKLYLHLIEKKTWTLDNENDRTKWTAKNEKKTILTHSHTHTSTSSSNNLSSLYDLSDALLTYDWKQNESPSFLFFACHQKDLAYFMISPTVNQWLLLRGEKIECLIAWLNTQNKKKRMHTHHRATPRGYASERRKKNMEMLMLR